MSNDSPVLTSLTENSTEVPLSVGRVENYVILLVLLCVFAGGSLILLSVLLLFCHRCSVGSRRYSRASDDPEKTNTTYVEDSQPTQDITIRLDESDALSPSSCHDEETDRFMSTCSTGRRVSFNESALYEQESKTQDKGRRYTLTEGDFHHLKKARLTHLPLAPPPSTLKILTIMECESTESSSLNVNEPHTPKPPLRHASLEGAGPYFRKWKFDSSHRAASLDTKGSPKSPFQRQRAASDNTDPTEEDSPPSPPLRRDIIQPLPSAHSQSSGLQHLSAGSLSPPTCPPSPCLSRLEVEAVVEAASSSRTERNATHPPPEPPETQERGQEPGEEATGTGTGLWREAGAVTRKEAREEVNEWVGPGEESDEDEEEETDILGTEQRVGMGSEIMEGLCADEAQEGGESFQAELGAEARIRARTVDGLGATTNTEAGMGLRAKTGVGAVLGTEREVETEDRFESTLEVEAITGAELEIEAGLGASGVRIKSDSGSGLEGVLSAGAGPGLWEDPGPRSRSGSGVCISRQESSETQPSLYRDIWSLRASLEQYASSDQSSTDRESIRSDADSVCSLGGAAARSGFAACLSQDLGDELEEEWEYGDTGREGGDRGQRETEGEYRDTGRKIGHRGVQRRDSEGGGGEGGTGVGGGGEGEVCSRKLLQMDSGYTSIEAPIRAPEELRLFGAPVGPRGKTASERRLFFTSSGRKGTVCESFEAKVFQEELEDEMGKSTEVEEKPLKRSPRSTNGGKTLILKEPSQSVSPLKSLQLQQPPLPQTQPIPSPRPVRLRRRDYSIDEKTDALFNEFLRHDPRFDQQESPLRSRHRSRIHLRKQWQRHKQYSDPGSGAGGRYSPSLERQSFRPLRRGDSAGYPLDTRYHSTLSRIASAADEETSEGATSEGATNEGAACEGAVHENTDVKESTNQGTGNETVANQDTAGLSSDTLRAEASGMDPRVDNYNNNSSQALTLSESYSSVPTQNPPVALPKSLKDSHIDPPILHIEDPESPGLNPHPQPQAQAPSPCLSDKLSVTLEDRLYTGLWRTGQGQGGPEYVVGAISLSSSPEPSSPV
ncbi:voltage-dependent calcium channel beta subunit-associated regulatory protein-like [Oncorhynchus clarkii lewisi]|uniref:voltage-dependent calcium channel beta subunit-associated regulatory protein-like n=1 Tax=Oncorhynchus clarkii lewisi TaxID=490388 RepID=UPI0039B85675